MDCLFWTDYNFNRLYFTVVCIFIIHYPIGYKSSNHLILRVNYKRNIQHLLLLLHPYGLLFSLLVIERDEKKHTWRGFLYGCLLIICREIKKKTSIRFSSNWRLNICLAKVLKECLGTCPPDLTIIELLIHKHQK